MVNTSNPSTPQHRRITGSRPALGYKMSSKPRLQDVTLLKKTTNKNKKQNQTNKKTHTKKPPKSVCHYAWPYKSNLKKKKKKAGQQWT